MCAVLGTDMAVAVAVAMGHAHAHSIVFVVMGRVIRMPVGAVGMSMDPKTSCRKEHPSCSRRDQVV